MCRKGELRVDGGRVKAATRLEAGQTVRVPPLPEAPRPGPSRRSRRHRAQRCRDDPGAVLWKDEHIIALNKPPGLPSQGGSGQGDRHVDGLTEALMFGYKERPCWCTGWTRIPRASCCWRAPRAWRGGCPRRSAHRTTRKIYWALVAGRAASRMGTIRYGLVKAGGRGGRRGRKMRCIHPDRSTRPKAPSAPPPITRCSRGWASARPGWRWCRSPGARTSCARIWPRSGHPDRRRRQVWRLGAGEPGRWLGRAAGRRDQPQAAPARALHPLRPSDHRRAVTLTAPLPEHMAAAGRPSAGPRPTCPPTRSRRRHDRCVVVFDVDGTLIDSQAHIVAAMERGLRRLGLVRRRAPPSAGIVGLSLPQAMARLAPDPDARGLHAAGRGLQAQLRARARQGETDAPLYPGARAVLGGGWPGAPAGPGRRHRQVAARARPCAGRRTGWGLLS
jgi:23S rRNA pseudouridine955/2504/2580 synthase